MEDISYDNFLNTIMHLDYVDIIKTADLKCVKLGKVGGRIEKKYAYALTTKIQGILVWIKTGAKPDQLSIQDFKKLRPLCKNLVAKKQLSAKALEVF